MSAADAKLLLLLLLLLLYIHTYNYIEYIGDTKCHQHKADLFDDIAGGGGYDGCETTSRAEGGRSCFVTVSRGGGGVEVEGEEGGRKGLEARLPGGACAGSPSDLLAFSPAKVANVAGEECVGNGSNGQHGGGGAVASIRSHTLVA